MLDKILVFGDSIAYGKWDREGGWVARVRKYIDEKYNIKDRVNLQVYNLGIPGEVAIRLVERVESELSSRLVDPEDEVLVIFAIGINDSCSNNWMTEKQSPESDFKKALRKMAKISFEKNCKVVYLGLTPVNTEKLTGRGLLFTNEVVKLYDSYISDVAKRLAVPKLELFDDLKEKGYPELLVDIVHPNSEGHKIISRKVIKFLSENFRI